ncbi:M24 family metallopeptidase [Mucisphaera calidilacus]|uniref:Putative peptidase n=1 Tax=Mucisphaera calidilacus TaxID=2527982 RepID=A0A518BY64_9BACT|nr:aminopeptidase P family protein [Mucisphaera calidilacus]QDU71898.1 putative peptidase [Mucisphaera calidilacus]
MASVNKAVNVHARRVTALRKRLGDGKVDAVLLTRAVDVRYLTGFSGEDSWVLVPLRRGKPVIISDRRFEEEIAASASGSRAVMRDGPIATMTGKVVGKRGFERVGFDPSELSVTDRNRLVKASKPTRLVGMGLGLSMQRSVKSDDELALIRRAIAIQQLAFVETTAWMKVGMTELEVAAYLEYRIKVHGGEGVSFPTIVAAGARSSLPHAMPSSAKIRRNQVVLFDWGAKYDGYCSDMTRVVVMGRMSKRMREVYAIVLEAQLAGIDAIAPGVELRDVDEAAREVVRKAGYGKEFLHSLGHGIGLEIHEEPRLWGKAKGRLEVGQVVTVEPGIYLPGVGGVRIEDDVVVTASGHEVLCDLPKGLDSATL